MTQLEQRSPVESQTVPWREVWTEHCMLAEVYTGPDTMGLVEAV